MPAIQPDRLKKQITTLSGFFYNPQNFLNELRSIFSYYSNYAHRSGKSGRPTILMDSYNLPKPVLRHIQQVLKPLAYRLPNQTMALSDALWSDSYLETHLIAAFLIGNLPSEHASDCLRQIDQWLHGDIDEEFLKPLAEESLQNIRHAAPSLLIHHIEIWLGDPNITLRKFAFQALITVINDPLFENLPLIINIINPYTRSLDDAIRHDILDILLALITRSPIEIAYLLSKNYQVFKKEDTAWLIRQSIGRFPIDLQTSLKDVLRLKDKQ